MWSFVKVPRVLGNDVDGIVSLEKYYVAEGDHVEKGDALALAHTEQFSFDIISNYRGRILKLILPPNTYVGIRDPIATIELLQEPIDGLLIEDYRSRGQA